MSIPPLGGLRKVDVYKKKNNIRNRLAVKVNHIIMYHNYQKCIFKDNILDYYYN